MLWSIKEIKEGESITVRYRQDSTYFVDKCACASCQPDNPPVAPRRSVASASSSREEHEESSSTLKRKSHRGGRRKRNKRLREWEELDQQLEELDRTAPEIP